MEWIHMSLSLGWIQEKLPSAHQPSLNMTQLAGKHWFSPPSLHQSSLGRGGRDRPMERRTAEDVICYSGAPERELPSSWRKAKWQQTSLVFFQALRLTVEHLMIELRLNVQSRPVCCCNRGPHRRGPTDATSHTAGHALIYDRHTLRSGLATRTVPIFTYTCLTWGTTQCINNREGGSQETVLQESCDFWQEFAQQHACTQYSQCFIW